MDSEIVRGDIPIDLIIDILSRLPAKSIVRWMSTCKGWYSFIKSSEFITKHLNNSKIKDYSVIIVKEGSFSIFSESNMNLIEQESGRIPFPVIEKHFVILGSYRGLILVKLRSVHCWLVLLWNPSLEKFKLIDTIMFHWRRDNPLDPLFCLYEFALGFDEASNDYRIVRITTTTTEDVVDVYSLTTDSWHLVDGNLTDGSMLPSTDHIKMATYINGAAHWIAYYDKNLEERGYYLILSFDFDNEVFKVIKLPFLYHTDVKYSCVLQLEVLDGKLALFSVDSYEISIRTWVMMNYPIVESWTKYHCIFEHQGNHRPRHDCLYLHQGNQKLWLMSYTKKGNCVFTKPNAVYPVPLLYYNAREDKVYDLGVATPYRCSIIADYTECLVFLDVENAVLGHTP